MLHPFFFDFVDGGGVSLLFDSLAAYGRRDSTQQSHQQECEALFALLEHISSLGLALSGRFFLGLFLVTLAVICLRGPVAFPFNASYILLDPGDLFDVPDSLMMRLAEPMRLPWKSDKAYCDTSLLQRLVKHHTLADGIGCILLAVKYRGGGRHVLDE